jgi:hypothetical protein
MAAREPSSIRADMETYIHNLRTLGEDVFVSWASDHLKVPDMMRVAFIPEEKRNPVCRSVRQSGLAPENFTTLAHFSGSISCCQRPVSASGHAAAAPPRSEMNSRRLTRSPRRRATVNEFGTSMPSS